MYLPFHLSDPGTESHQLFFNYYFYECEPK